MFVMEAQGDERLVLVDMIVLHHGVPSFKTPQNTELQAVITKSNLPAVQSGAE